MNPHPSVIRSLPVLLALALIPSACVPPGGGPPPATQTGLSITSFDDDLTLYGTVAVNAGGIGGNAVGLTFTLGTLTAQADSTGTAILDTRRVADVDHLLEASATVAATAVGRWRNR